MKCYVTKYALTKGIIEVDGEPSPRDGDILVVLPTRSTMMTTYYHKSDWFPTLELARVQAEKLRKAKIASLRKQISKLESLQF